MLGHWYILLLADAPAPPVVTGRSQYSRRLLIEQYEKEWAEDAKRKAAARAAELAAQAQKPEPITRIAETVLRVKRVRTAAPPPRPARPAFVPVLGLTEPQPDVVTVAELIARISRPSLAVPAPSKPRPRPPVPRSEKEEEEVILAVLAQVATQLEEETS